MVFSSVVFLFYFLPVFIVLYYMAPGKAKNTVLLAASLFFYAFGEPVYIILMLLSILVNYAAGIYMAGSEHKKGALTVAVIFNIAMLAVFKYSGTDLPLPVGISFYTFQAMSYIIDLYRGEVRLQKNIIDFAAYISMFPQLIAGPIIRLKDVEEPLRHRTHSIDMFSEGIRRFITGLAKKVLLANNAGLIWDSVQALGSDEMSTAAAWIGVIAFTFQIYFDFSGYSDMAIGLGKMIGFSFPENFNYPYMSVSITEFWRRWHISLGTWFREYLYIPLGGNRRSFARNMINIFIVWFLTGLWHGASINFVIWGLYFGVLLVIEKFVRKKWEVKLPAFLGHIYTMFFVIISWAIFSIEDMGGVIAHIGYMFGAGTCGIWNGNAAYLLESNFILFVILIAGCTDFPKRIYKYITEQLDMSSRGHILREITDNIFLFILFAVSIAYTVSSTYNPFLYFRF